MKRFLLVGLLVGAAGFWFSKSSYAHTDWYILNFGQSECDLASTTPVASPQDAIDWLNNQGLVAYPRIFRNPDGSIQQVLIAYESLQNGGPLNFVFFDTKAHCEQMLAGGKALDIAADPNELK